ncbi:MAG: calcium/sodium antiporter [Dehalococcoidia bacterium]
MDIFIDVVVILACMAFIGLGAVWLVDSAARVARRLGVSELVVGLTIVAFGTSAPEFGVTILAAIRGMSDISVGNIVGSNIFNLGLILGGTAIVRSLGTSKTLVRRDGVFLFFGSVLLIILLWNLSLNRIEGAVLFTLLIGYVGYLYWKKEPIELEKPVGEFRRRDILFLLLGVGLVVGSSHFMVDRSVHLAKIIGISEWVIGATIVAAGTSMPEFATSLVAALRGRAGMSVGNLIGSDTFNLFGVLGLAAILGDLPDVDIEARSNLIALAGMVLMVLIFMRTGWRITRKEGIVLVVVGVVRWVLSFT